MKVLGLLALPAWCSLPAGAQTYTATYTGIIDTQAIDTSGYFGGGNLEGDTITTTYSYSLSNGADRATVPGSIDQVYGGTNYGVANPILSVSITVDGFTQIFTGYFGDLQICAASACFYNEGFAELEGDSVYLGYISNAVASSNPDLVFDLTAEQDFANQLTDSSLFEWGYDRFYFTDTSVAFNGGSAPIPEPFDLAMFGSGVLALSLMRNRRA